MYLALGLEGHLAGAYIQQTGRRQTQTSNRFSSFHTRSAGFITYRTSSPSLLCIGKSLPALTHTAVPSERELTPTCHPRQPRLCVVLYPCLAQSRVPQPSRCVISLVRSSFFPHPWFYRFLQGTDSGVVRSQMRNCLVFCPQAWARLTACRDAHYLLVCAFFRPCAWCRCLFCARTKRIDAARRHSIAER